MEWSKIKNIIIIVLLLVNGFLLVLVAGRRGEVLRYEQAALEQSLQVLEKNGISTQHTAIADNRGANPLSAQRSLEAELRLAGALLGEEVEGEDRGGGLYLYTGTGGRVSFRTGGEMEAVLGEGERWAAADPQSHASALLRELGVESVLLSAREGEVVFRQLRKGMPLFSGVITFTYSDGRLEKISGILLTLDKTEEEESVVLDLPTALMRFLDEILSSGDLCSSLRSVTPGYRLGNSFTGTVYLNPVWLISTNTADYYLDGVTGELTRVSEISVLTAGE